MKKFWIAILAIEIIVFLLIKFFTAGYSVGDENIYFKMGELLSRGEMPYKDFFYSHPPVQIMIFAIIFKIFGFNFLILKLTESIAAAITSILIYLIVERRDAFAAIVAASIYLFSSSVLIFSSFANGIALTAMFAMAGIYFMLQKKNTLSASLFAASFMTNYLAILPIAAALLFTLTKSRKQFVNLAFVSAAITSVALIIMISVASPAYIEQTVSYHFKKPAEVVSKIDLITSVVLANLLIFAGMLSWVFLRKMNDYVMISMIATIFFFAAILGLKSPFNYYFLIVLPFMAMIAAYSVKKMSAKIAKGKFASLAVVVLIALSSLHAIGSYHAFDDQDFEAEEISAYIMVNSLPTDRIFGDDSVTGLLSLLSEREIALNFIDSNNMRFRSGMENADEVIENLDIKFFIGHKLDVGIGKYSYGLLYLEEFERFANQCSAKVFKMPAGKYTREIDVYDCE